MNLQEIHAQLSEKFGDKVEPFPEIEAGEGWIEVAPEAWHEIAGHLRNDSALNFDYLRIVSGVDRVDWVESVYHLLSYEFGHEAVIKVRLDAKEPKLATVSDVWPAANWHEREAYDLLGIRYEGHPDMHRILLPEDWDGHPLRKDYQDPEEYHGISNW